MNPRDYAQLLYEALEDKTGRQQTQVIGRFKALLARNRAAYLTGAIEKEFQKIQNQKGRENIAYIVSASRLSENQKQKLGAVFFDPREFSENPSLLGGIAVRHDDKIYNATLRKKVESLKSFL